MQKDYSKYCFNPMKYKKLLKYYEDQRDHFWTFAEVKMDQQDRLDWLSLNENETKFLTFVLSFFSQVDGLVIENLFENFQRETSHIKEANAFYSIQNAIETIHNETYSILIDTFIQDLNERQKALSAIENYPSIKAIADWIIKWMDSSIPLTERIVAFACVEGVFFSSAFCAIYWIKNTNKLRGLCKANELIARDEAIHTEFAIALYHHLTNTVKEFPLLETSRVHEIVSSAVEVSSSFVKDALQVELIGINSEEMIMYVKCTSDRLVDSLGYETMYNLNSPFPWMQLISLPNKTNFFEDTVSEYSKVEASQTFDFTLDEKF
jgi:ribonucleotide reductase beta subunit family protein with ferritin-like domain